MMRKTTSKVALRKETIRMLSSLSDMALGGVVGGQQVARMGDDTVLKGCPSFIADSSNIKVGG
jgi:hypothetical protein